MKYSYEFKLKAVNLYHEGKWIDAPEWVSNNNMTDADSQCYISTRYSWHILTVCVIRPDKILKV